MIRHIRQELKVCLQLQLVRRQSSRHLCLPVHVFKRQWEPRVIAVILKPAHNDRIHLGGSCWRFQHTALTVLLSTLTKCPRHSVTRTWPVWHYKSCLMRRQREETQRFKIRLVVPNIRVSIEKEVGSKLANHPGYTTNSHIETNMLVVKLNKKQEINRKRDKNVCPGWHWNNVTATNLKKESSRITT